MVSLTLKEGQTDRLTVFNKKALRETFGTMRDLVTKDLTQLHGKAFSELYSSRNSIRAFT